MLRLDLDRDDAAALCDIYQRALDALSASEALISNVPDAEKRRQYFSAYTSIISAILFDLRAPLVVQYPELNITRPEDIPDEPDTAMDEEELAIVGRLTDEDIARIDALLLAECAPDWRKVARIVGNVWRLGPDSSRIEPSPQEPQVSPPSGTATGHGALPVQPFSKGTDSGQDDGTTGLLPKS